MKIIIINKTELAEEKVLALIMSFYKEGRVTNGKLIRSRFESGSTFRTSVLISPLGTTSFTIRRAEQ